MATAPGAVFFPYRQFSSNNLHNSIIIAIFARIKERLICLHLTIKESKQWRVTPITILKVREAARRKNISANDFVEQVLTEATKDIETEEEKKERLDSNDAFLELFAGKWPNAAINEKDSKLIPILCK